MKKILITGGAGGVGAYVTRRLAQHGHSVRVFDLPSPANLKAFSADEANIETAWGDITKPDNVREAVCGVDEVIHLAAIVPPATEINPDLARRINVEGTRNTAQAAVAESESTGREITLRFSSSVTVFGVTAHEEPPIPADHPVNPNSTYAQTKVEAEEIVRGCGLPWSIFRFAAAQYITLRPGGFQQMRIIPPENRIEFIHIRDIADAYVNAIDNPESLGKNLILAGGPKCQFLYREQIMLSFNVLSFPEPNWKKFTTEPFALDWYDTTESQRILKFQNRTFDDYIQDFRAELGWRYYATRYLAGPLMKLFGIHL